MRTEDWSVIPDDRQTRVEIIGGYVVQDFGLEDTGTAYSCKATMTTEAGTGISGYWRDRELVDVRDVGGNTINNCRVVIKKYGYVERFEAEYFWAEFEFWRV